MAKTAATERRCSRCKEIKPLDAFHNDKNKPLGKCYLCKPCNCTAVGEWQKRNVVRRLETARRSARNNTRKGTYFLEDVAHLSGSTWECLAARLVKRAGRNAKKRGFEFTLTRDDVLPLLRVGTCPLSGYKFRYTYGSYDPYAPSIDRIDSGKGYTPDNIRVICYLLNVGMNQFGFEVAADIWETVLARRASRAAA